MQTQDQKRAKHAYEKVRGVPKGKQSKFKTFALKFPAMVLQCGVLQTLAYQNDKADDVFREIDEWLLSHAKIEWGNIRGRTIIDRLCDPGMDISNYRLVTREALAYGTWLKRASEIVLQDVRPENE